MQTETLSDSQTPTETTIARTRSGPQAEKFKLLDLFSGAGGAAMGYHRAGFDVTGVDLAPQKHYPFTFIQADALEYIAAHGHEYDVIHASPPCQEYSRSRHIRDATHIAIKRPKLIGDVRQLLNSTGRLWVIENVEDAPLPAAIELCGSMFGLPLLRHRWFEASVLLLMPGPCNHPDGFYNAVGGCVKGYGDFASKQTYIDNKGRTRKREGKPGKAAGVKAMGIDWMTVAEMCEAIPPAYTEYIGRQLMRVLNRD